MDRVEIIGVFVAGDGAVRVIGGEPQLFGINQLGLRTLPRDLPALPFVRFDDRDMGEERLARFALIPVAALEEDGSIRTARMKVEVDLTAPRSPVHRLALTG